MIDGDVMKQDCNIILAAGKHAARDIATGLTSSDPLTLINGRPVISWIIRDLVECTQGAVIFVCNKNDKEFINFYEKRWGNLAHFHLALLEKPETILHSLQAGLNVVDREKLDISTMRVMLGDTILRNVKLGQEDAIYVSDFEYDSRSWCVVSLTEEKNVNLFYEKRLNLSSPQFKALVGRYEFVDIALFEKSLKDAIQAQETELSSMLSRYNQQRPLPAIDVAKDKWIDCGHLEGVAMARQKLIESRHFNSLQIDATLPVIIKRSSNKEKIKQEVFWYENLPGILQSLVPKILDVRDVGDLCNVSMEYYGYGNLAEKFIYYDLPHNFWSFVLDRLFNIVAIFRSSFEIDRKTFNSQVEELNFEDIYLCKITQRLNMLESQNPIWPSFLECEDITINGRVYSGVKKLLPSILEKAKKISQSPIFSIIHGDLCFGNILFDVYSGIIKLIDPRGKFGTKGFSILGDARYDIAKIRHSYCGDYDSLIEHNFFIAQNSRFDFVLDVHKENLSEREALFDLMTKKYGYNISEIKFIEAMLFLTMIPLHQESLDRQLAMWLIATMKLNKELSYES